MVSLAPGSASASPPGQNDWLIDRHYWKNYLPETSLAGGNKSLSWMKFHDLSTTVSCLTVTLRNINIFENYLMGGNPDVFQLFYFPEIKHNYFNHSMLGQLPGQAWTGILGFLAPRCYLLLCTDNPISCICGSGIGLRLYPMTQILIWES